MQALVHKALLTAAIAATLTHPGPSSARDLGNFDINATAVEPAAVAATTKVMTPAAAMFSQQGSDALGRATFSWVQQDLPVSAGVKAGDPEAAARAHLGLLLTTAKSAVDVSSSLTLQKIDLQRGGAHLVQFQPRLDGIAIFREDLALLMDANQRLVAMRGPLPTTSAAVANDLPKFGLDASQAVAAALAAYEFEPTVASRLKRASASSEYQHFRIDNRESSESGATVVGDLRARRVYFRTRAGLQPAWYVETQVADAPGSATDAYAQVVSAVDGSVLFRIDQRLHADSFSYRVWAENSSDRLPYPSPQGRNATPDPDGLPTNNAVPLIAQDLRSLANAPFSRAATDGWLNAGATVTRGNNVNAYADLVAPSGFGVGDVQPTTTAASTFDHAYDIGLAPNANATQQRATTVQLFYWVNWLHDWFYDHGFTEADGNAQVDNFGRGGLGGDPILAEAQDYAIVDNASIIIPADGVSPYMEMGLFNRAVVRDSSLDGGVVAHEWAHYLSYRLIANSTGLETLHAGGLGEGWSDFVGLLATVKEEDRLKPGNAQFGGAYNFGGYAGNNTYSGERRYPYSTDLAKSPLTLRHIVNGVALPTTPAPAFGPEVANNTEVHNQGEIWAAALWECYVGMLNDATRPSFLQAQSRMKDYLVGGLKLTPAQPTMVEARDAILATILANGAMADFALFTAGFAKRGLGAGAYIPDRYSASMQGTLESTAVGADIAVTASSVAGASGCDADGILDTGETAQLTIRLGNAGFAPLSASTATLSSSNPALTFPSGTLISPGPLPLFAAVSTSVPIRLAQAVPSNTPITVTVTPDAPGINSPPGVAAALTLYVNFDEAPRSSATETFDEPNSGWIGVQSPVGEGAFAWAQRADGTAQYQHGPDDNLKAITWTQSPPMSVGPGALTLTLNHRYAFEGQPNNYFDGGVIQVSTDGGASWAYIDPNAAGYAAALIPGGFGNPAAGQRAYGALSPGYPAFSERVINLGTAYANQSALRLRFGTATDQSISVQGWDINRITVTGLNDTPFTSVVGQAPACSASHAGVWYWKQTTSSGAAVTAADPARYRIEFSDDTTLRVRADCNQGSSQYTLSASGAFANGPIAMTKIGCSDESQDLRFLADLARGRTLVATAEQLIIGPSDASSAMHFSRDPRR